MQQKHVVAGRADLGDGIALLVRQGERLVFLFRQIQRAFLAPLLDAQIPALQKRAGMRLGQFSKRASLHWQRIFEPLPRFLSFFVKGCVESPATNQSSYTTLARRVAGRKAGGSIALKQLIMLETYVSAM